MAIKLNCLRCKKALRVKDELAGKRVKCPGCQQVLVVPEPAHPSAEVEALAAAALSDAPAATAAVPATTTLDFPCPFCDETIHTTVENAGRQMPCPECSRIVKVPLPEKTEPKDWRKVDTRGPAAGYLKDAENAPEGAWGSKTTSSGVSKRALIEAEVIPVAQEPTPWGRYARRGLAVTILLAIVVFGRSAIMRYSSERSQQSAFDLALKALPDESATAGEPLAEVDRGAGEFCIGEDRAKDAQDFLSRARTRLASMNPRAAERDLLLIDLALTQVELGGDKGQDLRGTRVEWDKVSKLLGQTLSLLNAPEAKSLAVVQVGRRLLEHGQGRYQALLINKMRTDKDRIELAALTALELARAGETATAKERAAPLLKPYEIETTKKEELVKRPVLGPNVLALAVALDQKIHAERITVPVSEAALKDPFPDVRLGYARGWSCKGMWALARQIAAAPGNAALRFEALVDVATFAEDKSPKDVEAAAQAAFPIWRDELQKSPVSPWLLLRLVRLGAGSARLEDMQRVAEAIPDAVLRNRARLEITRARLATLNGQPDPDGLEKEAKSLSNALILEAICRHNARYSSSSSLIRDIDQWDPKIRPFGYIGVALGQQDAHR
jgi:hypothetical protein